MPGGMPEGKKQQMRFPCAIRAGQFLPSPVRRGIFNSAWVILQLAKFIVPVFVFIRITDYLGLLRHLAQVAAPLMGKVGLPGEASLALILSAVSSPYAGLAVLSALPLSARQLTIGSSMLIIAHSVIVEGGIAARAGASGGIIVIARLVSSAAAGLLLNAIL